MSDATPPRDPDDASGAVPTGPTDAVADSPAFDSSAPDSFGPDSSAPDSAAPEPAASEPAATVPDAAASEAVGAAGEVSDQPDPDQVVAEPVTDEIPTGRIVEGLGIPPASSQERPPTRPVTQQFPDEGFEPIPDEPGPPAAQPVKKKGRSGWRTAALITTAVLLLTVIVGVGTELFLRNRVTNCLQSAFSDLTGTSTSVSMPRSPMLFSWASGSVAWVQVDTNDSASGSAMRLHARADDVSNDGRSVESLRGTVFAPYERVQALTDSANGGGVMIEQITGDGATGLLTIDSAFKLAFLAIPTTVTVKPVLTDGKVDFQVSEAKILGIGLPTDFPQQIVDQLSAGMLGPLFNEIAVQDLKVTDQGIEFAFSGENVNLQATSQVAGSPQGACGV